MSSFENTLARMKDLYTYGKELNESNKTSVHTLEHSAKAADGITYGIIRECNKYYIKSAPKGKETVAESYDYLGGICNKKNYEYTSYSNALKNFELKMASINEACDSKVNISTNLLSLKSTYATPRLCGLGTSQSLSQAENIIFKLSGKSPFVSI